MRERIRRIGGAIELSGLAGTRLAELFCKITDGEEKGEGTLDLVSEADTKVNEMILLYLSEHYSNDGILSEESKEIKGTSGYRWIIDPLDGTHNFLAGLNEFGFLLALEERGQVILGICYFPALREYFIAQKGEGAYLNGEKIKVSDATDLRGQMFFSDGILRKKPEEILGDIERFCGAGCRLRVYGSTAVSMTRVAKGSAIIATNRAGKPWDIAAPALIVEEAGGRVTDEKGKPWRADSENIIATNNGGLIHTAALLKFK